MKKKMVAMVSVALVAAALSGCGAKSAKSVTSAESATPMTTGVTPMTNEAEGECAAENIEMSQARAEKSELSGAKIEPAGMMRLFDEWYAEPSGAAAVELKFFADRGNKNGFPEAISSTSLFLSAERQRVESQLEEAETLETVENPPDEFYDTSDSMEGLSIELTKIYEVDADGNRGAEVVAASGKVQEAPIAAGKTYEAELNIYNDSEVDVMRIVEINLGGYSNGEGFLSVVAFLTRDVSFWAMPHQKDSLVISDKQFFLKADADLVITPENFYDLIGKDSEQQLLWHEIGVQLKNAEEVEHYHLRAALNLRNTSVQTITFRFTVA